jgi:hypothetical protein
MGFFSSSMRSLHTGLLLVLLAVPAGLFAQGSGTTMGEPVPKSGILSAVFSEDYDSVTVVLAQTSTRALISYQLYLNDNGLAWSSGSVEIRNDDIKVLRGFRQQIMAPGGTGKGTLELRVCPQDPKSTAITNATCGTAYVVKIDAPVTTSFSDITDAHPNAAAIRFVHEEGIVAGYPDGTFKAESPIIRAEFTKIISLATASQEEINACQENAFSDVPSGEWYVRYLCHARRRNMIDGYPDGTFQPAQQIAFVEAAKILSRAFDLVTMTRCGAQVRCPQTDTPEHPWFEAYVLALEGKNAIPRSIIRFEQKITRGEMAEMVYRLEAGITTEETATYGSLEIQKSCDDRKAAGHTSCE